MHSPSSADAGFGINVIGYISGNLGLGVATRNTVRMLTERGVPTALTDVDPGGGRMGHDTSCVSAGSDGDATPYPLTIFHMNPLEVADQLWTQPRLSRDDRISACVPFWELPQLPAAWLPVLEAMDIILAPSRFIEQAVKTAMPDAICIYYQQAVFIPDDVSADRARWGIPADALTFVSSFDITSDIERKNPEAAVRAFQTAFPERDDVRLVLKVNSSPEARVQFAHRLDDLRQTASSDSRIILIDQALAYRDVLSLYASSDVLVSLHRSEGLGLSLMEAMSLGRAVIATAWSGNMDFMTPENSFPIRFDIVPVESELGAYRPEFTGDGATWADADVEEAAAIMRRLADEPALLTTTGEQAKRDMATIRARYAEGEVVESLRSALGQDSPLWDRHPERRARLWAIARGTLYRNVRRLGGRVLRRLRRTAG